MKILGHCPFIGTTGYANHSRSFFCALNKYHEVKIRNFTIGNTWDGINNNPHDKEPYFTKEMSNMLILQTLFNSDKTRTDHNIYDYKGGYEPDVHIVLMETNHHYFYDDYDGYKIAYNVWESTRYPDHFFNRLFYFDEVWVPTQWQFDCLVDQGFPKNKIRIVPEGVDVDVFKPIKKLTSREKFRFVHFGRWDYRKGTTEILKAFSETFKNNDDVELLASVENPFPYDNLSSTEDRISHHNIDTKNIKFLNFPSREEYINYLQNANVFVSCSRSEGWNLPLIESMSCGTPSIYSDWGGQLQFAKNKGIPVKIKSLKPANIEHKDWPGEYCEPDWDDLKIKMKYAYENYKEIRTKSIIESKEIHKDFNWDIIAKNASNILTKREKKFAFVTTGNIGYMPVIEKLCKSLLHFSNQKIIIYGVDCEVPIDYPNVIKRQINPPKISEYDKWYWKQHACIESLKEDYDYFIWIDGDVVVNYNIDNVSEYFNNLENYPLSDIHVQDEFFGVYDNGNKQQLFNEQLCNEWGVKKKSPYSHICFYIYDHRSKYWFEEIINHYENIIKNNPNDYKRLFLWNDEGIDNAMRWKYNYTNHLPLSNFDTSSYDGDNGFTNSTLNQFYTFWNEEGPKNFNRIFGYQFIPKDKSKIIYFHGNKNHEVSDKMIEFINLMKNRNFYESEHFYTDVYKLENFGDIKEVEGSTISIANKYGWGRAIYHEIYNLRDYYNNREKRIHEGDIVVDLGGNIGVFNRWAYSQGASKVISFEPDRRYFKLLKLNSDPRSILFNAAMSDTVGELELYESSHLGGSSLFEFNDALTKYPVKTYTLDYLFYSKLVDRIDFLKIDIEGAEQQAILGISDSNLMKVKNIAIEYHNNKFNFNDDLRHKLIIRLNNLGFNSFTLYCGNDNALQLIYFWR